MNRNAGYNVAGLIAGIFGEASPVYLPWGEARRWKASGYSSVEVIEDEQAEYISCLGTPVLNAVKFMSGSYSVYNHLGMLDTVNMNEFILPYATLVDFRRAMNVTETKVLGSCGTVKEIYGLGDWQISIRGICLPDTSRSGQNQASEQADALATWMNICDSINVESSLFSAKDIHAMTIKDTAIRAVQGKPDVISFEINAVSDQPVELIL